MSDPLIALHRSAWQTDPVAVVTAPGRVNLMGDHIDYAHLPVLPMAVQLTTRVAVGPAHDDRVRGLSATVPGFVDLAGGEDPHEVGGWGAYVAAALGQVEFPAGGACLTVGGTLPTGGGLSSSSALMIGVLAAFRRLAGVAAEPDELLELSIAAERALGVAGGAMDQTVIVRSQPGCALLIDFVPPSVRSVPIPHDFGWVAAYSGERAAKTGAAREAFNDLSLAARAVAALVGEQVGLDPGDPPRLGNLRLAEPALTELISTIPDKQTVGQVETTTGRRITSGVLARHPDRPLALGAVGRHLIDESGRVAVAEQALIDADRASMGRLMTSSHSGLRSLGTVTAGLEQTVSAMVQSGADGARVTGAGFGGYAVGLCAQHRLSDVREAVITATGGPAYVVQPAGGVRCD